jgi:hypothetical protein
MFQQFLVTAFPEPVRAAFFFLFSIAPIWLPIFLGAAFVKLWMIYVRAKFISEQNHILLELRIPQNVDKSPLSMEAVLMALHQKSGEATFINRWIEGKVRAWFSLELVSLGGQVHMYIWTRDNFRRLLENNLYAQFPDIEIVEVPDYTRSVRFDLDEIEVWGVDFALTKPDPYPIKTYIDYGLDKDPDNEYKIDPMAHVLEFLGSAKPHEMVWMQILIRMNRSDKQIPGKPFEYMDWQKQARMEMAKIRANPEEIEVRSQDTIKRLSDMQKDVIKAIDRSVSKQGFDTIVRGVYIAEKGKFEGSMIPALLNSLKQFNAENFNGFTPTRYMYKFAYPWQDYKEIRQNRERYRVFDAFRKRAGFHTPYRTPHNVLNTEELATLFHIPGQHVETPNLQRIPSQRHGAPSNLPV